MLLRHIEILLLGTCCLLLQSCEGDKNATIYKIGRTWNFEVFVQDSAHIVLDSFSLKMTTRSSSIFEKAIRPVTVRYDYAKNGKIFDTEATGIIDNTDEISIHPPRKSYFDIAEIVPFPRMSKPLGIGFKTITDMTIQKAFYLDRGHNTEINLAGKNIKQELSLTDSTILTFNNEKIKCHIIEGKNLNYLDELGQFSCKFYFNKQYGFVKFEYYTPWQTSVTAILSKIEF